MRVVVKPTVLLADDSEDVRVLLRIILDANGFEVSGEGSPGRGSGPPGRSAPA